MEREGITKMKVFKKYIRTKEGIYQQRKPLLEEYIVGNETFVYSHASIKDKDIIQDANTIEELCDEFVIRYKDGTHDTLNYDYSQRLKYMEMEQYNMELTFGNCDLFGAIWTDKGLIYVAKMNEKGELELL